MSSRTRLVTPEDATVIAELQTRNRAFLAPWEPVREDTYFTVVGQRADITTALERHERGESLPLVVLDRDGEVAGRLTLSGIVRGSFLSCSMGYWLSEDRTGQGLATEAVEAAVHIAFDEMGLHRVEAGTLRSNSASQGVLGRAGFKQYGLAPGYLKIAGRWEDHVLFQRLNPLV